MKRLCGICLVLTVLVLTFVSCLAPRQSGTEGPGTTPFRRIVAQGSSRLSLPEETLLQQVEADYAAYLMKVAPYDPEIDGPFLVMNYYGSYGGAVPVMMGGMVYADVLCEEQVADETFYYGNSNFITVWKNGDFLSLEEAYGKGYLTKDDVALLARLHNGRDYIGFRYEFPRPTETGDGTADRDPVTWDDTTDDPVTEDGDATDTWDGTEEADTTDEVTTEFETEEDVSEEEAALITLAEQALFDTYGITDLKTGYSTYRVNVFQGGQSADGQSVDFVNFRIYRYGYSTGEHYTVTLKAGKVQKVTHEEPIPASAWEGITEKFMADAVARMDQKTAACRTDPMLESGTDYYLRQNQDGDLCLVAEYIVTIAPPTGSADTGSADTEEGEITSGCGIDHEHYFFSEPILPPAP